MTELDWLYSTQGIGVKLGLDNMKRLLGALPVPAPEPPPVTIHVAGTNGKGSVCAFADAILRAHGLSTGLFTSPHLVQYHERMRVDGQTISARTTERLLAAIRQTVTAWSPHPSFFEITLALALSHFYQSRVEYLILETGLGGRLDATNAVEPRHVSVITPIDFDHTRILGDTLAKIASEKAGIFRAGVPVLSSPQAPEALAVLEAAACQAETTLTVIHEPIQGAVSLPGEHQRDNAALAAAAVAASGLTLQPDAVAAGLSQAHWPGRFQQLGANQRHVIDGAHNPSAARVLIKTWQAVFGPNAKATLIFGCAGDKDSTQILQVLAPVCSRILLTPIRSSRTADPRTVYLANPQLRERLAIVANVSDALEHASRHAERVLIAGSLFLAGEALAILQDSELPQETSQ